MFLIYFLIKLYLIKNKIILESFTYSYKIYHFHTPIKSIYLTNKINLILP